MNWHDSVYTATSRDLLYYNTILTLLKSDEADSLPLSW